jgi:hypothetical protein
MYAQILLIWDCAYDRITPTKIGWIGGLEQCTLKVGLKYEL